MTADKPPKRVIPIHPILFAIFPIVSLLATNISEVELEEAFIPAAGALAVTAFFFLMAGLALRTAAKGAFVTTLWLLLFFSYGHLYGPLNAMGPASAAGHDKYLAAWIFLGTLGSLAISRTKRDLTVATKFLNIVGLFMLILPLVNIVQYERSRESSLAARSNLTPLKQAKPMVAKKDRPDIYYFIFDRYSSAPVLKKTLDFDNSQFMDRLRGRGFFVAEKSRANYPITYLSLSSSLNLAYHKEARDQKALEESLQDHLAQRFLKGLGYKYLHYGSDWPPTNFNRFADRSISFDKSDFDPFSRLLLRTTMAGHFIDRFKSEETENGLLSQLRALSKVPEMEGPKFVFSHILLPHEPYSFDARGRPRSADEQRRIPEIELYKDYIRFANKKIGSLVDDIIIRSKRPPVIIIQADEGFRYDTTRYTKAGHKELHYGILNAFYLPGVDAKKVVYDSITPVNSLRAVFNAYFDAGFELLDDENYRLVTEDETIKGFERVTDELRKE